MQLSWLLQKLIVFSIHLTRFIMHIVIQFFIYINKRTIKKTLTYGDSSFILSYPIHLEVNTLTRGSIISAPIVRLEMLYFFNV